MNLLARAGRVVSFNVLQTILSKFMGAIQLAILLRLLSLNDIGAIGLAGGYVGLLAVLQIAPETIFVRDFSKLSKNLNEVVSAFLAFGLARGVLIGILGIPVAVWIVLTQGRYDVAAYFFLFLTTQAINALTGPLREAFYAQYRQARITVVDLATNVISLLLMGGLFFYPNILAYGILQLLAAILGMGWWYWNAKKYLGFRWSLSPAWKKINRSALAAFGMWNHLTSNSLRVVYQADVVVLSFFVGLADVGAYSIALTIANLFFLLPQYVQKVTTLALSGEQPPARIQTIFGASVKYNAVLTLLQFAGWVAAGPLLLFLLGVKDPVHVGLYALLLVAGTSLFNLVRPWMAFLNARYDQKKMFTNLFLYPGFAALALYAYAANTAGIVGVAWANIFVYGVLALLLVLFTQRETHTFPAIFPLWGAGERRIWNEIKKRIAR